MCGLIYTLNSDTYATNSDDWMHNAFLASQVRGTDSTGLFVLDSDSSPTIHKVGINASNFLNAKTSKDLLAKVPRAKFSLGHVRAATMGSISADNAHPFKAFREDGSFIIGAHNGTLTTWRRKKNAEKYTVDSEWLFNMLAEEGHDAFEYFNGAFALVWYDSREPDAVFMARNAERPLHYLVTEKNKTILGCSELGMLGWLSDKHGFKMSKEHPSMYYLEAGLIYKFSLKNIGDVSTVTFPKYDASTSIVETYTGTNTGNTSMYPRYGYSNYGSQGYRSAYGLEDYMDDDGGYSQGSAWDEADTERTLKGVKDALRAARTAEFKGKSEASKLKPTETIIGMDSLEDALTKAVLEHNASKALIAAGESLPWESKDKSRPLDTGDVYLTSIPGTTATKEEKENASGLGVYGMVVKFKGTWFDEEKNTCLGDFTVIEDGKPCMYEAELRMTTSRLADDLYIKSKPNEYELCVVTGVHESVEWIVVEPLTSEQRAKLVGMLEASNRIKLSTAAS